MQGDMTEAMKTLDAGMAAAELELRASSKALPVNGPASNPDGSPGIAVANSLATDAAMTSKSSRDSQQGTAVAGTSPPVVHQQNSAQAGPSSETAVQGSSEAAHHTTRARQTTAGLEAGSGISAASQGTAEASSSQHAAPETMPSTPDAAPHIPAPSQAPAMSSTALQTSGAPSQVTVSLPSTASVPDISPSDAVSATCTHSTAEQASPDLPAALVAHDKHTSAPVIQLHASASSSGGPAALAPKLFSEIGPVDPPIAHPPIQAQQAPGMQALNAPAEQEALQQPSANQLHSPPLLPYSATAGQDPIQATTGQEPEASSVASAAVHFSPAVSTPGHNMPQRHQATGPPAAVHPAAADACSSLSVPVLQQSQAATEQAPASSQMPCIPSWQAEEGHFALMLQEFVVSMPLRSAL